MFSVISVVKISAGIAVIWEKDRPTFFCEIEDTLIFLIDETIIFGPPVGPLPLEEAVRQLSVNQAVRTTLPSNINAFDWTFTTSPDHADYVFKVSDLSELPGHKYQKKRQLVRGCLDRYSCSYEPITKDNRKECLVLLEELYDEKTASRESRNEHRAIERLFEFWDNFEIFGGLVRIEGKVQGFMIGKALNPATAVGHAEKTSHEFHGLSELMIHWFCKHSLQDFTYLNLEQDLGIPGIREAKRRLRPDHMVVKWKGVKNEQKIER